MLLVEARQNNLHFHHMDNIDFFHLLEIILDKDMPKNEARAKAIQYSEERQTDKSVIMAVAGAADSKIDYNAFERREGSMCTLFDTIARENKVEGRAEEIVETGYEFGLSEKDILERLQKKLDVSLQKAQEYFNMFKKQTV